MREGVPRMPRLKRSTAFCEFPRHAHCVLFGYIVDSDRLPINTMQFLVRFTRRFPLVDGFRVGIGAIPQVAPAFRLIVRCERTRFFMWPASVGRPIIFKPDIVRERSPETVSPPDVRLTTSTDPNLFPHILQSVSHPFTSTAAAVKCTTQSWDAPICLPS